MENEANAANFEELEAHIQRLSGKLGGMAAGTDTYAETKELMEDYYERLIAMKNMSIDTLQCRLVEAEDTTKASLQHQSRQRAAHAGTIAALAVLTLVLVENKAPGLVTTPVLIIARFAFNSPPLLMLLTAIGAHLATKWRLAADD